MLYEDILRGFAVEAMALVDWGGANWTDEAKARRAMVIAVAMAEAFSATLKARRDAAEQAAKKAREDAARAESSAPAEPLPACDWTAGGVTCGEPATARRAQRGFGGPVRSFCAAHEAEGETLGYWLPKVQP